MMRRFSVRGVTLAGLMVPAVALAACGSDSSKSSTTTSTTASSTTTTTAPPALDPRYLPLYPFANTRAVAEWRRDYRDKGTAPEFLDAGKTAIAFAKFLGYTEIERVVTINEDAQGAHVSVGAEASEGDGTAAVVHLVRFGHGDDAPWEVVGTDDADFSITAPTYGSIAASPLPVAGLISGVDESITVDVRESGTTSALGTMCCVPAGGLGSTWLTTVSFSNPAGAIVIVSAATGGHVRKVERFTITGARLR